VVGAIGDEWDMDGDIDVYQFTASAGQNILFDLDRGSDTGLFGAELRLFDTSWNLLARTTGAQAPGDTDGFDQMGFLAHTFNSGGTFRLVISNSDNRNADPRLLSSRVVDTGPFPSFNIGGYTLRSEVVPDAPSAPAIFSTSDTGLSQSDNVTKDTTPRFLVVGAPGGIARLYDGGSVVAQDSTSSGQGLYLLTTSALTDRVHHIKATVEVNGHESAFSAVTDVTIDTVPPTAARPDLDAASDSGFADTDNITKVKRPTFVGAAEAGSQVDLLADGVIVGTTIVTAAEETYAVAPSADLADGVHPMRVRVTDLAGNVSADSTALTVTIDTAAPAPPVPAVAAGPIDRSKSASAIAAATQASLFSTTAIVRPTAAARPRIRSRR
jgi:hypothetical protein